MIFDNDDLVFSLMKQVFSLPYHISVEVPAWRKKIGNDITSELSSFPKQVLHFISFFFFLIPSSPML